MQYIRTDYTNNLFLCKYLHIENWFKTNLDINDLVRHLTNLKDGFQDFEGFYVKDDKEAYMIFEKPLRSVEDYVSTIGGQEKHCNAIFFTILEALCELECLGLHHPAINGRSVFLVESKSTKVKMSNPFLYDTFTDEFVHVYTNPVGNPYSRKAFNKRKLQENVYGMCLLVLGLITKTPCEQFIIKVTGGYNYNDISKSLQKIPRNYSQKMRNMLTNILSKHVDCAPTPLSLCNQLGFDQPGNSYYKHTIDYYNNFDPFNKKGGKSKIFDDHTEPDMPIPSVEALDKTAAIDLTQSKIIGTSHRRKNNFIVDCDYYK